MSLLTHIQTFFGNQLSALGQISRFSVSSEGGATQIEVYDPGSRAQNSFDLGTGQVTGGGISSSIRATGETRNITMNDASYTIDRTALIDLAQDGGNGEAYLNGTGFYGYLTQMYGFEIGGQDYMLASRETGSGVSVYSVTTTGYPTLIQTIADTGDTALRGVTNATSLQMNGQTWLVTAAMQDDGLSVFSANASGQLTLTGSFGAADQLPIDMPTVLDTVQMGGQSFVLLGSYGTGSLTVLTLDDTGQLRFVDQANDTLDTRFDGTSALATFSQGGLHLVAVGGNDGGLSIYQMLPGGRLLHRVTVEDTVQMALGSIEQLEFARKANGVELLVYSARDTGLTRFELDPGTFGITATGQNGGDDDDILTAATAGGTLRGGAGDDIMIDSTGADEFFGQGGEDVFVFNPDTNRDVVRDFDVTTDKVDLSGYDFVNSMEDIRVQNQNGGIRLYVDGDELRLYSTDGRTIDAQDAENAILFARGSVIMPDPLPQTGSNGNDMFEAGIYPDTIDGGNGLDTVTYERAPLAATVDLANSAANGGAAEGYVLQSIEGIRGSVYNDRLYGDAWGNALTGLGGNDTLMGNDGSDWLTPGAGNDIIDGGGWVDMVSFVDQSQAVIADLTAGTVRSGSDTNTVRNVENLTGSIYGDFIRGDDNDNRLRGLGDYDWMVGSAGQDTIDGGTGRDMISYVYSPDRVVVDLGTGLGSAGQAAGDTLISVERVTGSIYSDLFYGSDGADDFRGLGGYDWFVGSGGGKDRYDGGSGFDMVSYAASDAGVSASLLLGRGSRGDAARDLYTSVERLTGSNFDDILTGDNGRNELRGQYGEDLLFGNGGVDRLTGGGSDDFLDGGSGFDYALFSEDRDQYTINLSESGVTVRYNGQGGDGTDTLFNIEALQFADDTLFL